MKNPRKTYQKSKNNNKKYWKRQKKPFENGIMKAILVG